MRSLVQLMLLVPVMAATNVSSSSPEASSYSSTFGPLWPAVPYCWTKAYHPTVIGTVFITVDQIHNTTAITTVYRTEVSRNGTLSIFTPPTTTNDAGTVTQSKEGVAFAYPTGYTQVAASLTWKAVLPTSVPSSQGSCCDLRKTTAFLAPSHTAVVGSVDTVDPDDPYGWYHTLFGCLPFDIVLQPAQVSSIYNNRSLGFHYTGCPYTSCDLPYSSALAASAISQEVGIFATSMTTLSSLSSSLLISSVSSRTSVQAIPETLPTSTSIPLVPFTTTSTASSTPPSTPLTQAVTTGQSTSTEQSSTSTQLGSEALQPSPDEQTRSSSPPLPDSSDGQTQMALSTPLISPPTQTPFIPPITLGAVTIQPDTASRFVVGSQTLIPGSSITVSSQIITYPAAITPAPPLPPITIGTQVITASSSVYIIDDQTLVPGATVTLSGTTIQLAMTPSQIIVGTDTATLATGNTGGYIWSGLGSSTSSTSAVSGSPTPYLGESSRSTAGYAAAVIAVVACMLWM